LTHMQPDPGVTAQIHHGYGAFSVPSADFKVSFNTPSSESVEIEATFRAEYSTIDRGLYVALSSSQVSYTSLGDAFEYDQDTIEYSDDEQNESMVTVKWILGDSVLASVGSSNSIYIAFKSSGLYTYIKYGAGSQTGKYYPPLIIKATAMPTPFTGT